MIKHQTKSIKIKIKMANNSNNINNICCCRVIPPTLSWRLTNFELDSLMKFNMRSAASPYYITLVARLPSSGLQFLGWIKSVIPWPSSEIGFSDTKRFYMLNESELQFDWISLYVELAICDSHRWFTTKDLSNFELEIVQVAIESLDDKEPPSIKSKAAVIYIAYKDLAKARTGEPYHCQAVVRRVINEATGTLSIQGDC
ncbi:unnamed protein product [Brassica oleracea]